MKKILLAVVLLLGADNAWAHHAKQIVVDIHQGSLSLGQVLNACPEIAQAPLSSSVDKSLVGKCFVINQKNYELRYFSFEETKAMLDPSITFSQYVVLRDIASIRSIISEPLPGIRFESFNFNQVHLEDGVYFGFALRELMSA